MASSTYLPAKEDDLAAFANNMSSYLSGDPAGFSVTIQQAADFAALASAFQAALTALEDPANRTKTEHTDQERRKRCAPQRSERHPLTG